MKAFIFFVLAAVILVQLTDALPHPKRRFRMRREALRIPRSAQFEATDDMDEKDRVMLYGVNELLKLGTESIESAKMFFDTVVRAAKDSDLNLDKETREMTAFSQAVQDLENIDDVEQRFEKTFELFSKSSEIMDQYDLDEVKNPTENQKTIARLYNENGLLLVHLQFLGRISKMRQGFITHFQSYIDSMTAAEKRKERKFVTWFNKFKNEEDFEKTLEIMFDFFDFLE